MSKKIRIIIVRFNSDLTIPIINLSAKRGTVLNSARVPSAQDVIKEVRWSTETPNTQTSEDTQHLHWLLQGLCPLRYETCREL